MPSAAVRAARALTVLLALAASVGLAVPGVAGAAAAPAAPTIVRNATAGNTTATVAWTAPTSDGCFRSWPAPMRSAPRSVR